MLFEVPYNFDKALIKQLLPYKDKIDFLYLPAFYLDCDNSRYNLILDGREPKDENEYLEHIAAIQEYFQIGLLIQSKVDLEIIDKYYNLGIKIFILNDDELAVDIKELYDDVKCILSITRVITVEELQNNDFSMYDKIVLFFNFCRQIQLLKQLPSEYEYILLINSHCVYNCDRCLEHWSLKANTREEYEVLEEKLIFDHCANTYREDRAFILPADLSYFTEYISNFKLVDRLMSTEEILYEVDRYTKEYSEHKKDLNWYQLEEEEQYGNL